MNCDKFRQTCLQIEKKRRNQMNKQVDSPDKSKTLLDKLLLENMKKSVNMDKKELE